MESRDSSRHHQAKSRRNHAIGALAIRESEALEAIASPWPTYPTVRTARRSINAFYAAH